MVLHTQASYGLGHRLTGQLWLDLRPDDVHWNLSDLGWGKAAWSSFYGPWQMGACVFALDAPGKFDPALTLKTLAEFPITTWCAPPTALRLIVRQDLSRWRFPHLRHCVSAGEPLNPEVLSLWREATGLTLHEAYGQTETVVLIGNFRSLGHEVRPGSMGKATPGSRWRCWTSTLREVPAGEEGEVAVRVKPHRPLGLFSEYWLNPEEMAAHFRGDWYLTGDRATRDADGYFWFIGRKDDVIKSSGYRIGPFEVESALLEHPAVLEAAVIGKPDPLRGQIVKACVVLRQYLPGIDRWINVRFHQFNGVGFRIRPVKLERGDDAEFVEARDIFGADELQMGNGMGRAGISVCLAGCGNSVERLSNGPVTDGVDVDDHSLLVCGDRNFRELRGIEQQFSVLPVRKVGLGQVSGVRRIFDYAVGEHLDADDVHVGHVLEIFAELQRRRQLLFGMAFLEFDHRKGADMRVQFAALGQSAIGLKDFRGSPPGPAMP